MKIWVDADACPVAVKEILYKAAAREKIKLVLVANNRMQIPKSPFISFCLVPKGQDVADNEIVRLLCPNDLVVTADIPLAARAVEKEAVVLSPRGDLFTEENIRERLSLRDFFDDLRANGVETGGPSSFSARDKQTFANALDRVLTRVRNSLL